MRFFGNTNTAGRTLAALLALSGCSSPGLSDGGADDLGVADSGVLDSGARDIGPSGRAPTFALEPADQTARSGESATFTARAMGEPSPSLQWEESTDGTNFVPLQTATSSIYLTHETTLADEGTLYRAVAENALGRAVSRAARLSIFQPGVVSEPSPLEAIVGSTITFSVLAAGHPAPALQWQRAHSAAPDTFVDIAGANGPDYTTPPLTVADDGARFRVTWSNRSLDGSLSATGTTSAATLTVKNALTAKQILAGGRWSLVVRPDGSVAGFGEFISTAGTHTNGNDVATRPVTMYPGILTNVAALTGHGPEWWALKTDGTVLHWGFAGFGSDGRGTDGSGDGGPVTGANFRTNAPPVAVLERVLVGGTETAVPVSGVCQIASGDRTLLLLRAIDRSGAATSCAPGAPKTLWFTGLLDIDPSSPPMAGTVTRVPDGDLPAELDADYAPVSAIYDWRNGSGGTTTYFIVLENGRTFGLGHSGGSGEAFALPGGPSYAVHNGGPIEVTSIWDTRAHPVRAAALGWFAAFVVRTDGTVLTHGYARDGVLGNGTADTGNQGPTPVLAETCTQLPCREVLRGVTAVASDMGSEVLVVKDQQLFGWGRRNNGVLGDDGAYQLFPVRIGTSQGFTAVALGETHALALRRDGAVFAWGSSSWGQSAEPNRNTLTTPTMVLVP
ncbi:MAG: hypothetical protein U1E65_03940 [Myxococcota bacterium]